MILGSVWLINLGHLWERVLGVGGVSQRLLMSSLGHNTVTVACLLVTFTPKPEGMHGSPE